MAAVVETTDSAEQHDVQYKRSETPTAEHGNEYFGGALNRALSPAFSEPPADGAASPLFHPALSHPANGPLRSIALKRVQQTHGNQFVQRTIVQRQLNSTLPIQRACACGGSCESCRTSGDAMTVTSIAGSPTTSSTIQLQPASTGSLVKADLDSLTNGGGKPLDERSRSLMATRFGQDFGDIRVHSDQNAARAAEILGANAFTTGRDIYFGSGKYEPHSDQGQRLLAHELTHAVQQSAGRLPTNYSLDSKESSLTVGAADDSMEAEADQSADEVMTGKSPALAFGGGPSSGLRQRGVVQRDSKNIFAGKSYNLKTNKGVLEMAEDWQTQLIRDFGSFPDNSKEKITAGRAMAIYTEKFLPKFRKAAEEGAQPAILVQDVMAGLNRSYEAAETERGSMEYLEVRAYRTWFPEYYSSEYFTAANRLRLEQQSDFAYFEKWKLENIANPFQYESFAAAQYVDGILADMLDAEGQQILRGQWSPLSFKDRRLFMGLDARDKAEAIGRAEWLEAAKLGDVEKFKAQQTDKRYWETVKKLAEFVGMKKGLLTGLVSAQQQPWIDGRIEDLINQLRADFGIQMNRERLLDEAIGTKELRVVTGRIDRSPEGPTYMGQRLTFRATLDYIPPGKQVRLGWRWKTGGRESKFLMEKPEHVVGKAALAEPLTLIPPFWVLGPYKYAIEKGGGMEVIAKVYLGDDDTPVTEITSGWMTFPERAPTEIQVVGAPEKTVQGAPVSFSVGPWIPEHASYKLDWYVDKVFFGSTWAFKYWFQTTGDHTVSVKVRRYDPDFFGDVDYGVILESKPVTVRVIEPTEFGESILSQLDTPLVPGLSQGSLLEMAKSTESTIQDLERRSAMEEDSDYWKDRLENQRERLRKIHELVPDLTQAETVPQDKLNLEAGRLYSGPIPAVLIHPEKGVTLPLAIYLTVQNINSEWVASIIDATGKIVRHKGSGSTTQAAYIDAFSEWQSDNEYPIGGQVVYRFDPVIFKGEGQPDRRSFSTTTPWKKAKDWWDTAVAVVGVVVAGLLLVAPEATITKALAIALLAAATARSAVAIKERMDVGYKADDKEILLEGISIAASVTGIGGTLMRTVGMRVARPLVTQVGTALVITSTATDVGTFVYATSEAIAALRAVDDDPTLDDAQKQVQILRIMAGLFVSTALLVASNKDLIKGTPAIKSKIEPQAKIELDAATRVDMELELKATGEHEVFLKRTEGMKAADRDRLLVDWIIDARLRTGLKPTPDNVRRVTDPKFSADYDAEITVADHTYRRSRKNGRWCRFTDPICGIEIPINPEVDVLLAKQSVSPDQPLGGSIEDITTHPGSQLAPATPGGPERALPAGMGAHKDARWAEYQKSGGTWPYDRWSALYDNRVKAKHAELEVEVKELQEKKAAAEQSMGELKKKADANAAAVKQLEGQAAIAKGDAKVQLDEQLKEARATADQTAREAAAAEKEIIDTQLKIQQKSAQLNVDARSRLPCFAAGTSVWTPSGPRAIEALRVNDSVLAYDLKSKQAVPRSVLEVHQNQTLRFYHVEVGGSTIKSTSLHRFWVESEGDWVETRNLRVGMQLRLISGDTISIKRIELHDAPLAPTFNLHIDQSFTYFVGAGVLVHNAGPTYNFGNLKIYAGINPNFPGWIYIGQTDDIARREGEHRAEAIEELKKPGLTMAEREFWEFKRDLVLEERVGGLDADQANYLEQKNITLERQAAQGSEKVFDDQRVMNRREQVSRKNMPELEKKIMADHRVVAAKLCP